MAEAGVLAYPVLLGAMYGVFRIGRDERWGVYEWLRLGALALLLGVVVTIQVELAKLGYFHDPLTAAAAVLSVIGIATLIGLYLWERWVGRAAPPAPTVAPQGDLDAYSPT